MVAVAVRPPGGAAAGTQAISGGSPASIRAHDPAAGPAPQRPSSIGAWTARPACVQAVSEQRIVPAVGVAGAGGAGGGAGAGVAAVVPLPSKAPSTAASPTPRAATRS